jgi:hypothetical protein
VDKVKDRLSVKLGYRVSGYVDFTDRMMAYNRNFNVGYDKN